MLWASAKAVDAVSQRIIPMARAIADATINAMANVKIVPVRVLDPSATQATAAPIGAQASEKIR